MGQAGGRAACDAAAPLRSQLESEKQAAMANLDKQVSVMADEILKRILPEGVRA